MATVSYQNWYVSQTYPSWDIPLTTDGGVEDLTGVSSSNFTMIFRATNVVPPVDTIGTGTFSIKVVSPGEILYKPSVADVASTFSGVLIVKANFPPSNTNADEAVYDPIAFTITAS